MIDFNTTIIVLVPYKITLLSNALIDVVEHGSVLVPYKITLLSNLLDVRPYNREVLVPYKITLLSNRIPICLDADGSFSTL